MGQDVQTQAAPASTGGSTATLKTLDPEALKKLMGQVSQGRTTISPGTPRPNAASPGVGLDIGMRALSMFVPFMGGAVQKAVKQEREAQVVDVMNKLQVIDNELQMAQYVAQGDKKKQEEYLNQSPALQAIFNGKDGKKFVKGMQKVFGQDLLNPEKQNTVFHDGLKKHLEKAKAAAAVKDSFARMFNHKQQQSQGQPQGQPQGEQQQQQQQGQPSSAEMVSRIPQKLQMPDPKQVQEVASTIKETVQAMNEQIPKTEFQAFVKDYQKEHNGDNPDRAAIVGFHDAVKMRPLDQLAEKAFQQAEAGDVDGYKQTLETVHMLADATHPTPRKNLNDMIYGMLRGNKEDAAAWQVYSNQQNSRAEAYGRGRAMWNVATYMGSDGQIKYASAFDVIEAAHRGEFMMPAGRLSADKIAGVQQLQSEAGPIGSPTYATGAIKGVLDNIDSYDDPKDRAIYAQILKTQDHENALLNPPQFAINVFDQALTANLSPQGRKAAVAGRRLAETLGRLRSTLSLPSTNQSMQLTFALMPGPTTPDSKFARDQVIQLSQTISNAIEVPVYKGVTSSQPKKSFDDYLKDLKNKAKK